MEPPLGLAVGFALAALVWMLAQQPWPQQRTPAQVNADHPTWHVR